MREIGAEHPVRVPNASLRDTGTIPTGVVDVTDEVVVKGCCPLDCQDTCAWTATVRDGRVVKVAGARDHPLTRGTLCAKVKDYEARTYAEERLLVPLVRSGPKGQGSFRPATWDEALDLIVDRWRALLGRYGGETLLPVHFLGSMGVVQRRALQRLCHALGASRQAGSVCGAAGNELIAEGHPLGFDPEEIPAAQLVVVWGANPLTTCHHHWRLITEARKNGARIVVIDPRRTLSARSADEHVPIRPGTDWVLARGMAHVLFRDRLVDEQFASRVAADLDQYRDDVRRWTPAAVEGATGVPATTVQQLAREYGTARPALIRGGIGSQQNAHGEAFVRALSALAILGGHWRYPGGGLFVETYPLIDEAAASMPDLQPRTTRALDVARLGETLADTSLEPPVKALLIWNTNPVVIQPDATTVRDGLIRDDVFTVVVEHFMTDTARVADVVLPSTTQLEHFDVLGAWGHQWITVNEPAIEPVGEARSHGAIMRALASRLGLAHPALHASDEEIAAAALPPGITLAELRAKHWVKSPRPRFGESGKPAALALCSPEPVLRERNGRLQLLTPKGQHFMNSTFANMDRQRTAMGRPTLHMHPDDAEVRGLLDGGEIVIKGGEHEIRAWLEVDPGIVPGVVALPGKWWLASGAAGNVVTRSSWSPSGQPAYNDTDVSVEARHDLPAPAAATRLR